MSIGNTTEIDLNNLIFNAVTLPWNGNANLFVSLHTADPGEAGNQSTSEATYTSYARVTVARTSAGWTAGSSTVQNASLIQFPQCTGGTNTVTYVAIGTAGTGTGQIVASGALSSSLAISSGIQPQFAAGALTFTLD